MGQSVMKRHHRIVLWAVGCERDACVFWTVDLLAADSPVALYQKCLGVARVDGTPEV